MEKKPEAGIAERYIYSGVLKKWKSKVYRMVGNILGRSKLFLSSLIMPQVSQSFINFPGLYRTFLALVAQLSNSSKRLRVLV